ncbi:hypothetical protein COD05_20600 [Bacillus cereus]|nr:hypothetical protein COJ40_28990 [Bacillus cereus]RFB71858.1 hypothetical protein DZB94_19890 [Bacillus sp. AW]PFM85935.1 hypothetical protein COJ53_24450 [Bacillus cereus]PFQ88194.1 hypothetical protein COK28_22030 [Bacillus cereus]PGP36120.1 hypothetical protein CN989_13845 [Bacillus cereus]
MWCFFFVFSLWYVKLYERLFQGIDLPTIFDIISYNKKTASYLEAVIFKSINATTSANAPNTTL